MNSTNLPDRAEDLFPNNKALINLCFKIFMFTGFITCIVILTTLYLVGSSFIKGSSLDLILYAKYFFMCFALLIPAIVLLAVNELIRLIRVYKRKDLKVEVMKDAKLFYFSSFVASLVQLISFIFVYFAFFVLVLEDPTIGGLFRPEFFHSTIMTIVVVVVAPLLGLAAIFSMRKDFYLKKFNESYQLYKKSL